MDLVLAVTTLELSELRACLFGFCEAVPSLFACCARLCFSDGLQFITLLFVSSFVILHC